MTVESAREFALPSFTARFSFAGHTDRGSVRRINEDSFIAAPPVFVVADGMGGHAYGDRASQAAVATFADLFVENAPADPRDILEAITAANDAVLALAVESDIAGISGTTLTGVAFVDVGGNGNYHWMAFNVGDSRTYSWDGRTLSQLSVDHSAVQELIEQGLLTADEATRHPNRNVVTRALGADEEVDPDVWILPTRSRQTFLLCSDGLTRELPDDEIARIIVFHDSADVRSGDSLPMTLAERLVNAAIAAGGSDNVTVVVVECELSGAGARSPEEGSADETLERGSLPGALLDTRLEDTRPRG
jgi:serine/threonine protein phosphatase PrpC